MLGSQSDFISKNFKSGFVTLVGRPNSGKSSLINCVMDKKIAITSSTVQTTRHRFRAVLTKDDFQLIMVDTPGLHKPQDALGEELNTSALKALEDVDVVAMVIDSSREIGKGDNWVASHLEHLSAHKILVLNKIDLVDKDALSNQFLLAERLLPWDDIVCLSALTGEGVDDFVKVCSENLPDGPKWFPDTMETDQSLEVIIAEFVREKILENFYDEIPHAIGVICDAIEYDKKKLMYKVYVDVYVERESQKGMIIGKGGSAIKEIGTSARIDLEKFFAKKVFLDLRIRVKKNWRKDLNQIRRFGYGEGI